MPSRPLRMAFVMDPIDAIDISADTTFVLMLEAQNRGHQVFYVDPKDLRVIAGKPATLASPVSLRREVGRHVERSSERLVYLDEFDAIFQRQDPPVDADFITATQILSLTETAQVFNRPQSILAYNEKLQALHFADLMPETAVFRRVADLREYLEKLGGQMIVKPLDGKGGEGVFLARVGDGNLSSILEQVTLFDSRWVVAQRYVPEIRAGDKRILLLDGEVLGAVLRVPAENEVRANLHVGARAAKTELDAADRHIVARIAPFLKEEGLFFVGIDVIGGYLTEINVTSPTGIQEANALEECQLETKFIERVEERAGEELKMSEVEAARPASREGEEGERTPYGVLIVDDEQAILESLEFTLGFEYRVFSAQTGQEGLEILAREDIALVISDQVMPGMSGVEFFEKVIERNPRAIRMMLTGYADMPSLVRAINEGRIYRYIPKPWEPDELRIDVKRALEAYELAGENAELVGALAEANERLTAENRYLRREVEGRYSREGIIGDSPAMQRVFDVIEKVSETDATVLLTGETGTGKDLVARAIHYSSSRKAHRFVAQNCGALPDTLLESELFGHKRGAFTGAHENKKGLFEVANLGTIFLDEVGETEPGMQVRLLRVLQDGDIRPLGSSDNVHVEVRVVAATNRDLRAAVEEGRFREDLYYRLRVVEIELPALRERREDIPALAHHFLDRSNERMGRQLSSFSNAAMDRLVGHEWRGNVRELENEIERIAALAGPEEVVTVEMLSERLRGVSSAAVAGSVDASLISDWNLARSVDALKRQMIVQAMSEEGSKTRAAERLGVPRQSLQKMIKRLQLRDEDLEGAGT